MDLGDLDFIAALLAHPEVMEFFPKCYDRDEAEAWVRRQQQRYAQHGCGYWLVLDKQTQAPVGQVGLMMLDVDGYEEPSLGYIIHRPFWRRGIAYETAAACRDHGFDVLDAPRVITLIRPENAPSRGVADKLGMQAVRSLEYAGFEHLLLSTTRADR